MVVRASESFAMQTHRYAGSILFPNRLNMSGNAKTKAAKLRFVALSALEKFARFFLSARSAGSFAMPSPMTSSSAAA